MKDNIKDFPGYHISREGLLYSRYNKIGELTDNYKVNQSYTRSNGYQQVVLKIRKLGLLRRAYIHRLVAEAYIPNPHNYPIVCHKDNNRTNNHVSNLYWGTQSMNIHQIITDGRNNPPIGNKNFYHGKRGTDTNNGKYSVRLKLRIYRFYKRHPLVTNKELRIKFGIKNRSTITKIISGRDMIIKEHYS